MAQRATSVVLLLLGLTIGAGGLALGAFLAAGNNGFPLALLYSVIGLIGAPASTLSWSSRRSKRRTTMAGLALLFGMLGSMGLLFDLTQEASQIAFAWSQAPLALAGWIAIWVSWQLTALVRLIAFQPPRRLRQRLSSRSGHPGH